MTTLALSPKHLAVLTVLLPPTAVHRIPAALAGALEEDLLDDPADLHFALAPGAAANMKAGQPFEVMVCNKAWLGQLIHQRSEQNLLTQRILPDDHAMQAAGWDLAQFDFAPRTALRSKLSSALKTVGQSRQWRAARVGALVLLVIQVIGVNVWAWRERSVLAEKRTEVNRILQQTFPATVLIVDAPAQMQQGVQALRARSGALSTTDLEIQLSQLGKPVTQIDYQSGQLKVLP
jgi:type II secretory pathway component PulL